MTLIELLIVIFIVALLMQLLLPALQSARGAARKIQCQNNLKQIALAFQLHDTSFKRFPSGGWHENWIGEPERGTDVDQPGSWVFNILSYIDAKDIRDLGRGLVGDQRTEALVRRCGTPIEILNCPTRRPAMAYPQTFYAKPRGRDGELSTELVLTVKTDYAANCGGAYYTAGWHGLDWQGPTTLKEGDEVTLWPGDNGFTDTSGRNPVFDGVVFVHSRIASKNIIDGASKTYLLGEKYLRLGMYDTGFDLADNVNMYQGFGDDMNRSAFNGPRIDSEGHGENIFGSAHPSSWNMAFVDGSVHAVAYDIFLQVHRSLASRAGEESLSLGDTQ
jgi:hypothetical protein